MSDIMFRYGIVPTPMSNAYTKIVTAIKFTPGLTSVARAFGKILPDRIVTRNITGLGPFAFRLKRHRWLLGDHPFSGHHQSTLGLFRQIIHHDDMVYDIGANIGYYTRFIVQDMGAKHVIAFEPMSENVELLERNVKLGNLEANVKVLAMALSDHDGSESLQIDDVMGGTAVLDSVSGGEASASRKRLGLKPKTETVNIRRLDHLIEEMKLPRPDVMKIDTEGAEAIVLRGAIGVLKNHRPRLLIALHGEQPARATLELLHQHDYICYGTPSTAAQTQPLTLADAVHLQDNNIIALPG